MKDRINADLGLLVLRIVLGVIMAAHGAQKVGLVGDGPGVAGVMGMVGNMGFQPPALWGWLLILAELGGIAVVLGFLTPLASLGIIVTMVVAAWKVHGANGFFLQQQGFEYNLALGGMALALLLLGPGRFSLDYLLFGRRRAGTIVSESVEPSAA